MHEVCIQHLVHENRMKTARVKQEEEADTRIMVKELYKIWKKGA